MAAGTETKVLIRCFLPQQGT